jgi:serine protease Do
MQSARGAVVADVQANSPAERGIEEDLIISVNGEALDEARSLPRRIGSMPPGTSVRLAVIRNGREETFTLRFGELH